jgi:hypothetical protein
MQVHTHDSTQDAYDACQTEDTHKDGDILHIPSEGVVGLVDTWPLAVTVAHGELHTIRDGGGFLAALAYAGITVAQAEAAVQFADTRGYPVDGRFRQ